MCTDGRRYEEVVVRESRTDGGPAEVTLQVWSFGFISDRTSSSPSTGSSNGSVLGMLAGSRLTCPVEARRFVSKVALALQDLTRVSISSLWDLRGSSSCIMGDKVGTFTKGGVTGWGSGTDTTVVIGTGVGVSEAMGGGELVKSKRSTRESGLGVYPVLFLVAATVWLCSGTSSKLTVAPLSWR
jgi:hypothetical protein